jgi:hypothetical protein
MKTFFTFCFAVMAMGAVSFAQSPTASPTPAKANKHAKTTAPAVGANEAVGTIVEFVPGGNLVLNTGAAEPMRFKLGKGVRYLNPKGKEINDRKMKKDRRVRVHYAKQGDEMVVDKVQIERDGKKKKSRH